MRKKHLHFKNPAHLNAVILLQVYQLPNANKRECRCKRRQSHPDRSVHLYLWPFGISSCGWGRLWFLQALLLWGLY